MVPPTLGKGELWAGVAPQGLLQRQCHLETEFTIIRKVVSSRLTTRDEWKKQ